MSEVATEQVAPDRPKRRRQRYQRGSIYRSGRRFKIAYYKPDGKQKWESGFETKAQAQNRLNEVLNLMQKNKFTEPELKLFKVWCEEWLTLQKGRLKPSTWISYNSAIRRWLIPKFGDACICDITRRAVVEFFDELERGRSRFGSRPLSRQFIKNVHTVLHTLFDEVLERDYTATNPAHKLKLVGGRNPIERITPGVNDVV